MKTVFSTILLITLLSGLSIAQPYPDTLWTRVLGGSGRDWAQDIEQTSDGGYVVVGWTASFGAGNNDIWLIRLDQNGDTLWTRTYGGTGDDKGYSVLQDSDDGFVIAGHYDDGLERFYLMKTDSSGNFQWDQIFFWGCAYSVETTYDGGYISAGFWGGWDAIYLVKHGGSSSWTRTFNNTPDWVRESARSVKQTPDSGYIVAGYVQHDEPGEPDPYDIYLLKTDEEGNEEWSNYYGGSDDDKAFAVTISNDGGYVVAGYTTGTFPEEIYLKKIGSNGWTRNLGSGIAYAIQNTNDGGYIIAANRSNIFNLLKTDDRGYQDWRSSYGGETAYSVRTTGDGGYVAAGYKGGQGDNLFIVKTGPEEGLYVINPNGGEEWRILQAETVQWILPYFTGGIKIELNRDYPSGTWEVLADSAENDGEESFFVTDPLSVNCRIKISTVPDSLIDTSDGNFSITSSQGYLGLATSPQQETPTLSWDAGVVECPLINSQSFYLKNYGNESILVHNPLSPTGLNFTRTSNCSASFTLAPYEVSACNLIVTYDPLSDGTHYDTLQIMTDAVNSQGGYVRIPLTGQQISTPAVPQVTISIEGDDARLTWEPITESILGCSVDVTAYLVFYSPTVDGPYYFHGLTADTTYLHNWVVPFASGMFYEVLAYTGELDLLDMILDSGRTLTREEVIALLNREGHHRTNR